jgi:hypothetical protein
MSKQYYFISGLPRSVNKKDLHTVKKKVEWIERRFILPEYVRNRYSGMNFWKSQGIRYD